MPPKSRQSGEKAESVNKGDKSKNKSMTKTKGSLYAKEPPAKSTHPLQNKLDNAKLNEYKS